MQRAQLNTFSAIGAIVAAVLLAACDGSEGPTGGGAGAGVGATGGAGGAGGEGGGGTGGTGGTGGVVGGQGGTGGLSCVPSCGATTDCLAVGVNTGKDLYSFRMSQLSIVKPVAMTNPVFATTLEDGITPSLPDCYLHGDGTMSWLLQFDTKAGTLTMGAGKPIEDPASMPYCFVNEQVGTFAVAPASMPAAIDAAGTLFASGTVDLSIPLYSTKDASAYVVLPLTHATITSASISKNHNCIGSYNGDKLDPADSCQPNAIQQFTEAGAIEGLITLEDADAVTLDSLGQSLCVLITGQNDGGSPKRCPRDANMEIAALGEWCSIDDQPGSCADALKFTATFAASAVAISGECQ